MRSATPLAALALMSSVVTAAAAAPYVLTQAEKERFRPHRHEIDPTRLESMVAQVAACGGPWEREFINEEMALIGNARVRRHGDKLFVGPVVFENDYTPTSGAFGPRVLHGTYEYMGRYEDSGFDLVHVQYAEGDGYVLVDTRTRTEVEFAAMPSPSPNGRYFAAASAAEAYNDHGVQIAEMTSGGLRMVVRDDERTIQAPCGIRWLGADLFTVQVLKGGFGNAGGSYGHWAPKFAALWASGQYSRVDGRWRYLHPAKS